MNVLPGERKVKRVYKVPEGLRELCTDIAREVLRSQPRNIYCFVADYAEALLITRENAKVAGKVVNNILLESQDIVDVLRRSGLSLERIARAAPRIQAAFRAYLDAVDARAAQVCDDATCDERSEVPLQSILMATGVPLERKKHAAIIQAAFRGYYEKTLLNEPRDIIQWQRPSARILEILRKTGASEATYRGYYTRRNLRMKTSKITGIMQSREEEKGNKVDVIEPAKHKEVTWLNTTYKESETSMTSLVSMRENEAAFIIQKAYRRYRQKRDNFGLSIDKTEQDQLKPTRLMTMEYILNNLHQKVFDEVMARTDIPVEFDNQENLTEIDETLERIFKNLSLRTFLAEENSTSRNGT
ncbi:hypothetical protein PUN28_013264 [Cardiocondyla obscurior]|uniref:RIIa domain-containing protein n=1 Tax=Cardiocondyla obscurior TaxID=286306 RepID=A0AAW2FBM5_9HYME